MQLIRPRDFSLEIGDAMAKLRLWFLSVAEWIAEFAPLPRDTRLWPQRQLIHMRRELRVMLAAAIVLHLRSLGRTCAA